MQQIMRWECYVSFPRSTIKMSFKNPRFASYSMQKSLIYFIVRTMIRKSRYDFMMKNYGFVTENTYLVLWCKTKQIFQ